MASIDQLKVIGFVVYQLNVLRVKFDAFFQVLSWPPSLLPLITIQMTPPKPRAINAEKYLATKLFENFVMVAVSLSLSAVENRLRTLLESISIATL